MFARSEVLRPLRDAALLLTMLCPLFSTGSALAADAPSASAASTSASVSAKPAPNTLRIHYARSGKDEALWGVYSWEGPQVVSKTWIKDRFMFSNPDEYGAYADIPMAAGKTEIRFLVTNGSGYKNCGDDQNHPLSADIGKRGQEIWVLQASCQILDAAPAK